MDFSKIEKEALELINSVENLNDLELEWIFKSYEFAKLVSIQG